MDCRYFVRLMHQYLDCDATKEEEMQLRVHLASCQACKQHFQELKRTLVFVQSLSHTRAPEGFTERVMSALPQERRRTRWTQQFKRHPLLVAASLFIVLMAGSTMSAWTQGAGRFEMSAAQAQNLQVDESKHTVIVPAGKTVEGDIVVRNGNIRVDGEVKGNVVAIDGQVYMASTSHISGEVEEIHEVLEWVWYSVKKVFNSLVNR
ncbi:anti-sigma factor RsiW [Aneurinibacillus soli]|uniref:Anti-sigma-W factor RsiW n=1 Tax=Aneurinibacillus soli TaxID=1500254 RepID=A0A0U4WB32_9BACL|nr:zf-HC2 domain-containing protein [Aneurinibacillus soli]PYE58928.1 anti-sigma factor RsiW [Aneurinibacillus soli]BAU26057.1 Anti-sigma-W factor RsiW [Aneurinibacillus soli]